MTASACLARTRAAIVLIAVAGELGVLVDPPATMRALPEQRVFFTAKGYVLLGPDEVDLVRGVCPYQSFEEAEQARQSGAFSLRPQHPEDLLADLVDQLDAIGIPNWHGAEGLDLDAARAYLASAKPQQARDVRDYQRELDQIGWDAPDYEFEAWQAEVANGDTRASYADWVMSQREQARIDAEHDAQATAEAPARVGA